MESNITKNQVILEKSKFNQIRAAAILANMTTGEYVWHCYQVAQQEKQPASAGK